MTLTPRPSRPYIPLGCDQQGQVTPTRLPQAAAPQPFGAAMAQRLRAWWAAHIIDNDPADPDPLSDTARHEGWGDAPTDPRRHWPIYLAAFLIGLFGFGLMGGCATGPTGPSATVQASCPHPDTLVFSKRNDEQAQAMVLGNARLWYTVCREAALAEYAARQRSTMPPPPGWPGMVGIDGKTARTLVP